ncbi:MAG TPA: PAS domain S-box protein [Verrucomicrobiae bacterium]|nr:PAS domain S-box protein [Verrucomicrobiae bacterium]
MKTSVENKIRLGLAAGLAVLLSAGWLSYHTTTRLIATEDWVSHTRNVIAELESVSASLEEVETGQRGYILTGGPIFLEDRRSAAQQLMVHLKQLRLILTNNPAQQHNLDQLEPLIARRLNLLDAQIAAFQQSGLKASADTAAIQTGEMVMNNIRGLIAQMRSTEDNLLVQRVQLSHDSARWSLRVIVIGTLLACALGVTALITLNRDFKLRAVAEEKVRESQAQLEFILNNSPAIILLKDVEGRYLFVNRRYLQITGFSLDQVVGKTGFDLFQKEIAQAAREHDLKVLQSEAPLEFEETVRYPDGPHTHLAVKFSLRDTAGRIYALCGVSTDITERKQAEEERDRFFNLSRDLMCIIGFDHRFRTVNPAWERTLGFSREEMLGKPFIEFVHPDDRPATLAEAGKLAAGGEVIYFENRYLCKDGSYRWLAWSARAAVPQKLMYATARDITEQKRTNEQILQLNVKLQRHAEQLETANRELEAFSYSVSHDLRAPLRHIDGFVKILDKQSGPNLDERGRRYLGIVADSARQMGALIDDLLVFSRMGRSELRRSKVALDSLVHEAVEGLQMETNGRPITWKIGDLPEVEADPAMLRQVWINLVGNAVKYTRPRNPAEIEVGCADATNGEFVLFVRDNGVGFDMEYAHKLFGVFQRLHRAEEFEGTGIGLANVRRIIARHGGRTWAEGKPDGGATFFFSLPKTPTETEG